MARWRVGPGALIAAAFIGPGTVTTATSVGASYGYVLGWGILFSVLATMVLQEMAARLGVVGRLGLGEALRIKLQHPVAFALAALLVVCAIAIGNAAYEAGNLGGALLGAQLLPGTEGLAQSLGERGFSSALTFWLAGLAAVLLFIGRFEVIKRVLTGLVVLLCVAYLVAALTAGIDWAAMLVGLLPLRLPTGSEFTLIALIGTTIVPYNLFLHADAARAHYPDAGELPSARLDTYVSVALGGLVTLLIASLSAAAFSGVPTQISSATELAEPLRTSLGALAPWVLGLGLAAAGLTSAITAPLAAA